MEQLITGIISSAIATGAIVTIAGTGEVLSEKTGVINLGIEGFLAIGAIIGIIATNGWGWNATQAMFFVAICGLIMGLIMAILLVKIKGNQLLIGLSTYMIGSGIARHIGRPFANVPAKSRLTDIPIPLLSDIPIIGKGLFNHDLLVYLGVFILPLVAAYLLYRTREGIKIQAVGQMPEAADACGINVDRTRCIYVIIDCILIALAGGYMTLGLTGAWSESLVVGKGWITITMVIFSSWNPLFIVVGALIFGSSVSLSYIVQIQGWGISPYILGMMPYIITILLMVIATLAKSGKKRMSVVPAALALPYYKE
jgi:simple sugar transport system permease protein